MRVNETWMSSCVLCIVKCDALLVFSLSIFCWDFFSVMLWAANDGRQISDRCWKVSIVPSISVLLPGLRSLCPHVILLISLLSCRALLCPGVPFFLFVQPQGQVVLCSSKPFFCSAAQDFILFWFSVHNTTWLKLYFALFSAHCWAVSRQRLQDVRRLSMELLDYAAAEWQPFYWFIYLSILPL